MPPRNLARPVIDRGYVSPLRSHSLLLNTVKTLQGPNVRFGTVENRIYLLSGDIEEPGLRIICRRLPVDDAVGVWRYQRTTRRCVLFRIADRPARLINPRGPIG